MSPENIAEPSELPASHDAAIETAAYSMFLLAYDREYSSVEIAVAWREMIPERKTLWLAKTRAAIAAYQAAIMCQKASGQYGQPSMRPSARQS